MRGLARWIVVILLLGQLSIAAYACPALRSNLADVGQGGAVGVDCEMSGVNAIARADKGAPLGILDADLPNLCAEHCQYGQHSDQSSSVSVPAAMPLAAFDNNPPRLVQSRLRPTASLVSALASACPPHAILHCVRRS
ncbi:MAG: hypothetical protein ABJA49_00855 [Betaproteobacteria bacterium]